MIFIAKVKFYFQSALRSAPPIKPIMIGLNLEIPSGKNGVRLYPKYDKPKSAMANIINIPPIPCSIDFITEGAKKYNKIQENFHINKLYLIQYLQYFIYEKGKKTKLYYKFLEWK